MQVKCSKCGLDRELTRETKGLSNCMKCRDFLGENNPNHKYEIDYSMFKNIDTEEKAYLLGWIGSNGSISKNSITLAISINDEHILTQLRNMINSSIPIVKKENLLSFTINSQEIVNDVCSLFNVPPGKKSDTVKPPVLESHLERHFWRGYFDGDGTVNKPGNENYPKASVTSNSSDMRKGLEIFSGSSSCSNSDKTNAIYWSGNSCLDFLERLYGNATIYLGRKRDLYLDWTVWVPSLSGTGNYGNALEFRFNKTRKDAIAPSKVRASDAGYDLTLLEKVKSFGDVDLYDTGIKVKPTYGWYFDLVPRSSISKTGYMLANSIGVIDRTYVGNILVALRKVDSTAPDLELPIKLVQLIPRPITHFQVIEVDSLDETTRGDGGFGSTGR